jgi:predicted metal-binding membrane protein
MITTQQRFATSNGVWYLWAMVAIAWGLAGLAIATGQQALIDHDAILHRGSPPGLVDFLLFFAAWQVMTAAMMLPSSIPMMRLFAQISGGQRNARWIFVAFFAAYFVVWTGFAVAAIAFDSQLHALADRWVWLAAHPRLIEGVLLALAGLFQFTALKERCLRECRTPKGFLWRYYRQGIWPAWQLGIRHGLFCLGCCWALMLVMFGVGVGSLFWLTVLTGTMVIEKTTRWGRQLVPAVGIGLLSLAIFTVATAGI